VIGSGRCHGPGCQQAAQAGDFCGEVCQDRWHEQFGRPRPQPGYHPGGIITECSHPEIGRYRRGDLIICAFCDADEPPPSQVTQPRGGGIVQHQPHEHDLVPVRLSEGGWLPFWRGDHSGNHPDDDEDAVRRHIAESMDAKFRIASPRGLLSASAEFPQVASENPQVAYSGWRGWLTRLRRTR
jgi:hypothetical protein